MLMNVDPSHAAGYPQAADLLKWGFTGVRLVSRPSIDNAAQYYMDQGLMVLAVIARESEGHICPADVYQIGNEPDSSGESSWTRTPAEYAEDWRIYRETYPGLTMIAAGLTSGQTAWWTQLKAITSLPGCSGMAVHPYGKTAAQAKTLLAAYRKITPALPVWVTEWWRPSGEAAEFAAMLDQETVAHAFFCWPGMVPGFGITPSVARQLHGVSA